MSQTTVPGQPDATIIRPSVGTGQTAAAPELVTETLIVALSDVSSIRPFRVDVPEEAVRDLRQRLQATRWPDKETVSDQSQGPQLANLRELVRYWGTDYN